MLGPSPNTLHKQNTGFTLIETMVVVAIVAILAALAAPSMQDAFDRYRAGAVYDEMRSTYVFARSEAIRTRSRVIIQHSPGAACATTQEWHCGWIVYVDVNNDSNQTLATEPTLRIVGALSGGTELRTFKSNPVSQVVFDRWGNMTPLGSIRQTIFPRGDINSHGVKTMCVNRGGRFRVVNEDPSVTACNAL